MSDLQQAIDKLRSSPHYKELADYEPPFNPFEIAGVIHRELTHSSVLAWLLRDEVNKEFRQKFVAKMVEIATDKKLEIEFLPPDGSKDYRFEKVCIETEHYCKTEAGEEGRIDVFAEFETLKLVISIEVKIWEKEKSGQIRLYQTYLKEQYSKDKTAIVVFLTPGGYPSRTKSDDPDVPVLEISWSDIAWMIREMRSEPGNADSFRMQFSQHLDRNFPVNREQRIVHELLSQGNNLEVIKEITSKIEIWDNKETIEIEIDKEMVQKIINNRYSLQTSLEYEFWRELREKLQLQYKKLEFQLYKSGVLEPEVIDDERLKEYIKWGYEGSLGLTFRISDSSRDKDHEVACRITYDRSGHYCLYYGFVLCKKGNIKERVEIENDDEYRKKCLDLLGGEILDHGPDKKHGWLRWKEHADEEICFANEPKLFNTLVKIKNKERKEENVVNRLVTEICKVINNLPK